jgi:hypothetical protein
MVGNVIENNVVTISGRVISEVEYVMRYMEKDFILFI